MQIGADYSMVQPTLISTKMNSLQISEARPKQHRKNHNARNRTVLYISRIYCRLLPSYGVKNHPKARQHQAELLS